MLSDLIEMFMKDIVNLPVTQIHSLSNVNCSKINAANVESARIDEELSKYLNAIGAIIRLR